MSDTNNTKNEIVEENKNDILDENNSTESTLFQKLKPKKSFAITIFLAVLFGIVIANTFGGYVTDLIAGFFSTLVTFVSALAIIFILKHIMHFIEEKVLKNVFTDLKSGKKIKRAISITIAFLILILIIVLMMALIVPRVAEIVTELVNNRESYIYQIKSQLTDFITSILQTTADDTVNSIMVSVSTYLEDTFNNFLPKVLEISTNTIMVLGQMLLGSVLAFIYLYNRESINSFFAGLYKSKFKPATVDKTYRIMQLSDRVLVDYIIAKILEAIVITIVIGIGLSIIGVKYAFELALIIGILNVIPYIGFIIALVPTTLLTIIYGSIELAIQTLALSTILYIFLTTFITPIIVGKKIKVNILLMLSAMILFGGMFGMIGMAIAAPVACIFGEIFKEKMNNNAPTSDNDETTKTDEHNIANEQIDIVQNEIEEPSNDIKGNEDVVQTEVDTNKGEKKTAKQKTKVQIKKDLPKEKSNTKSKTINKEPTNNTDTKKKATSKTKKSTNNDK